jgi:hypothetical protein
MAQYCHHVSGIFATRLAADAICKLLNERGLPNKQLQIFDSEAMLPVTTQQAKSNAVLKDMLVKGAIGVGFGVGIGALIQIALTAYDVSLFFASPVVAPLALLGWGASLGGMAGATYGAKIGSKKASWLSDLVKHAITNGQVVLVAETISKQQTEFAREIIQIAVGHHKDITIV